MKNLTTYFCIVSVIIALVFGGCTRKTESSKASGRVISNAGKPVADAEVTINQQKTRSDKNGRFEVPIDVRGESVQLYVTIRKFGYGFYANRFNALFVEKEFVLTQGTITKFDPAKDTRLRDPNASKNPMKPALLNLDTAKLFKSVPLVFDASGNLIDMGYPKGAEGMFDYLKMDVTGSSGMTVDIPANSLIGPGNSTPAPGANLYASLSTVDFFNPDGMPGSGVVRVTDGVGYMESYGAGTIEISDGKNLYNLKDGAKAHVRIPVYPIRLKLNETLPVQIALLRFHEVDGVWDSVGVAKLNKDRTAYEGDVNHFSVLNMDMIKTGPSKCYKIRQLLKQGASVNSNYLSEYKAVIVVPKTATTPFQEGTLNPNAYISETSAGGCVPVDFMPGQTTFLHTVTRVPTAVPWVAAVFKHRTMPDVYGIAIGMTSAGSIPANTAVANATNCATLCNSTPCTPTSGPDPLDLGSASMSNCNTNVGCWLDQCAFLPFPNLGTGIEIVAIPKGGGAVLVKWYNMQGSTSMKITRYDGANCSYPTTLTGASVRVNNCTTGACGGTACAYGEFTDTALTPGNSYTYFIEPFNSPDPAKQDCGVSTGGFDLQTVDCASVTVR